MSVPINFLSEICNGESWFYQISLDEAKNTLVRYIVDFDLRLLLPLGLDCGVFLVVPGPDESVTSKI